MKVGIVGINDITTISRVWKLGSNIPHTASGETSVHTLQADAKRASSVRICLAN